MNKLKAVSFLSLLLVAAAPASSTNFEDEKAKLDAQIELVQKRKALQEALKTLGGASAVRLPSVVSVMLGGSDSIVRLQLPNGQVSHYRRGDMVQRGMLLTSVTPREVVVTVLGPGKQTTPVALEFASPPGVMPPPRDQDQQDTLAILPEPPHVEVSVPAIEVIPSKPAAKVVVPAVAPAVAVKAAP